MSLMWSVVPGLLPKDVATPASINDNTQLTLGDILLPVSDRLHRFDNPVTVKGGAVGHKQCGKR